MANLLKDPISLIIYLIIIIVLIALLLALYNFYRTKQGLLTTVQTLSQEIEDNASISFALNTEKASLEKDNIELKASYHDINNQFSEVQRLKENAYSNIRALEAEILNLKKEINEIQSSQILSRSGIYQTNEEETVKRVKEAVEPWMRRAQQLESEFDLYKINANSNIGSSNNGAQLRQLTNDVNILKQELAVKEEENIKLRLNLNKAITAYTSLKSTIK